MSAREYPKVWRRFERVVEERTLKFEIGDVPEALWSTAVEYMLGNYIREDVWWIAAGAAAHLPLDPLIAFYHTHGKKWGGAILLCRHHTALWSTAVEYMLGNYIREDVWWIAAGTAQDLDAVQEYRVLLISIVRQKMSLACFLTEEDGSGQTLVAVNMCLPQEKGRFVEHTPPKTKAGLLSLRMFVEAMKLTAIYDKYKANEYLMGAGLSVSPEYRGLGIAVELLNARMEMSKTLGYKVTGGVFTSAPAQRAAEKAGFECLHQITYKKFGKQCNISFNTETEFLKIFAVSTK